EVQNVEGKFNPRNIDIDMHRNAKDLKVAMINLGAALYIGGKQYRTLLGFRVPGWDQVVAVRSPRAGIIQVGEGLFTVNAGGGLESEANSLIRTAVFFHEARHSDGN